MNKSISKLAVLTTGLVSLSCFNVTANAQEGMGGGGMGAGMGGGMGAPAAAPLEMGFFITSVGLGNGADLGGLAGADAHCQELAEAVDKGDRTWRAYLSTQATDSEPAVNAIDRIGEGPWGNVEGITIAANMDALLYDNSNINYKTALTEKGETVGSRGMGDEVVKHDILTGTLLNGMAPPAGDDMTCANWTSSTEGAAIVGHSDRFRGATAGSPWNNAHTTRGGCDQESLKSTGGDGLFYCFAAD